MAKVNQPDIVGDGKGLLILLCRRCHYAYKKSYDQQQDTLRSTDMH
jgi:hypothetical protein